MKRLLVLLLSLAALALAVTPVQKGATIYVSGDEAFANYISAAIAKKHVPVTVVADKDKAEYELQVSAETEKAGWARIIFTGQTRSNENAAVRLVNRKTSEVIFAYAYMMHNAVRGKQSAAESCAKHLKGAMEVK
jgi:ActR/RegA family two-component response regulator